MAVGIPVSGTASQSNGAALIPTLPASVAANDIVLLYAVFYESSGTAPTVITWPSGFAEASAAAIKNASGTQLGVGGVAWKRMAGGESGTVSVSAGIVGSANGGSLANCAKVAGCVTTGDPWEDLVTHAPNFTTTVDIPSTTMARSTGGETFIVHVNSDNVNIGTLTNWTVLTANAGTGGLDTATKTFYRQPGATGTYDPASVTLAADNTFGWAAFHFMLTDTAGGAPAFVRPRIVVPSFAAIQAAVR